MGSTLRRGSHKTEVRTLKHWLNLALGLRPPLPLDTNFDLQTENAVRRFQQSARITPNGVVTGAVWAALSRAAGARAAASPSVPAPVSNTVANVRYGALNIRPDTFLAAYTKVYGPLKGSASSGLTALLRFISRDPDITDVRWAAYMLATTMHECARTWQPIEEYGRGKGRKYGAAVAIKGPSGVVRHVYYGRGYVQLTWDYNYKTVGEKLGLGQQLLLRPELALEPQTAYRVMSYGMRNGTFTTRKLSQYISGKLCNYVTARKIINGLDKAETIAAYARKLEGMLRDSLYMAAAS
jgi:hypothetical protein